MRKILLRVVLPIVAVAVIVIVLVLTGHILPTTPSTASIDVEKFVYNGTAYEDADTVTGPNLTSAQDPVIFKFTIKNDGNVALTNVNLTDTDITTFYTDEACTVLTIFPTTLAVDETRTFYAKLDWAAGQHTDTGMAEGTPPAGDDVSDSDDANYFGQDESPLKIVIYTDFLCGACERLHSEVEPELRQQYIATGKAEIEIRLLGAMDPVLSMRAAEAALCAGDQGKFLEYIDALFGAYGEEEDITVFSVESLTDLAAELGLDEAAFASCLNSEAKQAELEENMSMAQADDVGTLPAFLVGDFKIEGRKSIDTYIQAIETVLTTQPA
jgi:protein-disulfide isomerase